MTRLEMLENLRKAKELLDAVSGAMADMMTVTHFDEVYPRMAALGQATDEVTYTHYVVKGMTDWDLDMFEKKPKSRDHT